MENQELILKVVEKTGVSKDMCEKIFGAFESVSGNSIANKLLGNTVNADTITKTISEKTGISMDICKKVVDAITSFISSKGASSVLGMFK